MNDTSSQNETNLSWRARLRLRLTALRSPRAYLRLLSPFRLLTAVLNKSPALAAAAARAEGVRAALSGDVAFLSAAAIDQDNSKAFFGAKNVRDVAVKFTSIRNAVAKEPGFLINAALAPDIAPKFFKDRRIRDAAKREMPIDEDAGVHTLASKWTNKRRHIAGFGAYYDILHRLEGVYGDCAALQRLKAAALPEAGFASDIHLRDFLCDHLCKDGLFYLRDAGLEFVDRHAMWTLINEILVDEEYFFETDRPAPLIIDGGANFGMSTAYFKTLYPNATVLAFEPVPALHALAQRNVERNGFADVEIVRKGLAGAVGQATFFASKEYSMAGSLTDRRRDFGDALEEITIETAPLGDYIEREVDFLKLDIEGSEGEVLMALGDKLPMIKQMCVEWHLRPGKPAVRLDEALSLLGENGFDYQVGKTGNFAKRSRIRPMRHVGAMGTLNFWAKRR